MNYLPTPMAISSRSRLLAFALALVLGVVSTAFGESEFAWTPTAKSILGLLDIEQSLDPLHVEEIIKEQRKLYKTRGEQLEDSISSLKAKLKSASEILSVPVEGGDEAPEAISAAIAEKENQLAANEEILRRLGQMRLITVGEQYSKLNIRFINELRRRFNNRRQPGDGLKQLDLMIAYTNALRSEGYEHETMDEAKHLVEFGGFLNALADSKSPLTEFLPIEFVRNPFPAQETAPAEKQQTIEEVDRSMSRGAWKVGVRCFMAVLLFAGGDAGIEQGAHQRALEDLKPFPQAEIRGRERSNLPDGEQAAMDSMQDAAHRALPFLKD